MSAPDTEIEQQVKRHKSPLIGIAISLAFAGVLFIAFLFVVAERGNSPEGAEEQIEFIGEAD